MKEVWALAWPAITHMLLVTLVFMVDRALVGRFSSVALASMQLSTSLVWCILVVFTSFSAGTLAVVARRVGAGDRDGAASAAASSLAFAAVLGVTTTGVLLAVQTPLLGALFPSADQATRAEAGAYLSIVLFVLPFAFVEASAASALQASGDTRTPLRVATLANVVNIALSSVLVFGAFGLPRLGIRGAAIGTAAAMAMQGVLLTAVLLSRGSPLPVRAALGARRLSELSTATRSVLAISGPAFAEKVVYQGAYLGFIAIIGMLGTLAMAANQVLFSIESLCFLSADGFGIAAGALVAQKLGAGRPGEASRVALISAGMAVALLTTLGLGFVLVPAALMAVFTDDPAIVAAGIGALPIAALAQPFMAAATVLAMALRGAGDTRTVLAVTVVGAAVARIGATWLFAIEWGWGLEGVWWGSTADWALRTVLLGAAFLSGRWRRVRV